MIEVFDWILVMISTIFAYKSAKRLFNYKSTTIADYIMLIIYVFNCLPILLDLTLGIPPYYIMPWYSYFNVALNNDTVRLTYSIYILISISILNLYIVRKKHISKIIYIQSKSVIFRKGILFFFIILPFIYILLSGSLPNYLKYGSASARGVSNTSYEFICIFELIGLFAFCCWFFSESQKPKNYVWLTLYGTLIAWIDGKRYIVVTIILMFLFFYLNSSYAIKKRVPIKRILLVVSSLFILYYFVYAIVVKPTAMITFESLYLSFRVDFGRDDVTKFVLYRELIENNPILEYRGLTVLSAIFMLVPRSIWPNKPYPHYRYLTAELFGTTVYNIPAGMTPSLYEMSIANFGVIAGMAISITLIVYVCYIADKSKSIPRQALYLLLLTALLTQSMDAVTAFIVLLPVNAIGSRFKFKRYYYASKNSIT